MKLLVLSLSLFMAVNVLGQSVRPATVEQSYARKIGKTGALKDIIAESTPAGLIREYKANRPEAPRNFEGVVTNVTGSDLEHGPDPLLQDMTRRSEWSPGLPSVNVEGIPRVTAGSGVSDVNGDVSDEYYLQSVNATVLQVFDLMGNAVSDTFTTNALWSQLELQGIGDPIVLYDQEIERWLLTELTFTNEVLIALSEDSDPLGEWTIYALPTAGFPDYPKYGVWPGEYVLTTNELGTGGVAFYTINKEDMAMGLPMVRLQRFALPRTEHPGVEVCAPVGWIGDIEPDTTVRPMVIRINDDEWGVAPEDRVEIFEIRTNWDEPDSSTVTETFLPTTPFAAEFCEATQSIFVCVPQPGDPFISAIPRVLWHRVSYRQFESHGSIVLNFGVDATGEKDAGIRWMELRKETQEAWAIHQEGTIGSSDGENRFLGAISIDTEGNIGMGYAVSSERTFPSLRLTGRRVDDPLGRMTLGEIEIATGLDVSSTPRFGDYHSMSVDAQDRFWFTGQYVGKARFWNTRIAAFKVNRDSIDLGALKVQDAGADTTLGLQAITTSVRNFGNDTIRNLIISLDVNDSVVSTDTVQAINLARDSSYDHTFSQSFDFDEYGMYQLKVFVDVAADGNVLNDTCLTEVRKIAPFDAAVVALDDTRMVECDTDVEGMLVFANMGSREIRSIQYRVEINGVSQGSDEVEMMAQTGERISTPISLEALNNGDNAILVIVESVNQEADGVPMNDTLQFSQLVALDGEAAELELTTDFFPEDTRWELQDSMGNVLYAGGPYDEAVNTYTEEWCVDQSKCYRFIVFDDGGDGLEFGGVTGDWRIFDQNGVAVALLSDPAFGDADTTELCFEANCSVSARAFVTNETTPGGNNGVINFVTFGGVTPYEYSIDGGATFQTFPLFTDIAPGVYQAIVRDRQNCSVLFELTVLDCTVDATIEVTDASGVENPDGEIFISAINGRGPFSYSIDGGSNFQADPLFQQLLPDTFNVVVRDSLSCSVREQVIVDFTTSVRTKVFGRTLSVFPNPSSEIFNLELRGLSDVVVVEFEVIDAQGRLVVRDNAGSFNDVIRASFSLRAFPSGTYYVRVIHPDVEELIPVVKTGN